MEQRRRETIGELVRAGQSAKDIISLTGYPKSTVYRTIATVGAGGDVARRSHTPRSDRKRTPTFLSGLKRSIQAKTRTSMNKLARARHVSKSTISRAVREDLGMKAFTRKRRSLLTEPARAIRRERAPKVLNLLKHLGSDVRVFVDEKKFIVEEVANRRNSRAIAYSPDEVAPVMKGKNPASVMVFGAVASDGRIMPPHFMPAGVMIDTDAYLTILKESLIPWMMKYYDLSKVMLVQDSAPAHASQRVQDFLSQRIPLYVPKDIWPSNSPDLNPCDFWMWGVVEQKSNSTTPANVSDLKKAIRKAVSTIDQDEARRACSAFRRRLERVRDADGGHIE